MVANKALFANKGVVGACTCGGPCDIIAPITGQKMFSVSCMYCLKTWKNASTIEEAVNNWEQDIQLKVHEEESVLETV